jgi:hypothetical protein
MCVAFSVVENGETLLNSNSENYLGTLWMQGIRIRTQLSVHVQPSVYMYMNITAGSDHTFSQWSCSHDYLNSANDPVATTIWIQLSDCKLKTIKKTFDTLYWFYVIFWTYMDMDIH